MTVRQWSERLEPLKDLREKFHNQSLTNPKPNFVREIYFTITKNLRTSVLARDRGSIHQRRARSSSGVRQAQDRLPLPTSASACPVGPRGCVQALCRRVARRTSHRAVPFNHLSSTRRRQIRRIVIIASFLLCSDHAEMDGMAVAEGWPVVGAQARA